VRVAERGRCHVLGPPVQGPCDGVVVRIWHYSPVAGKDLVGPPAEQEGVGALEDPVEERRGLVDEQRRRPSAALESAPAVLVRPAEALHHSIDGDVRDGRQFHGFVLSLVVVFLVMTAPRCGYLIGRSWLSASSSLCLLPLPTPCPPGPTAGRVVC